MERRTSNNRRYWWWLFAPVVAGPFGVLFSEAWMHTQILRNQYRVNELAAEIAATASRVNALRDDHHLLVRMERMEYNAQRLGLVVPKPGQVQVIEESTGAMEPYAVAQNRAGWDTVVTPRVRHEAEAPVPGAGVIAPQAFEPLEEAEPPLETLVLAN